MEPSRRALGVAAATALTAARDDRGRAAVATGRAAHAGVVRWVVRQQWRGELSFADALHEGRLGLWRARGDYDPARGTRFRSDAGPAIRRAVAAAVAAARAARPPPAPPAPPVTPTVVVEEDPAAAVVEPLHREAVRVARGAAVGQVAPRTRQVVVWHDGLDGAPPQTCAAIGARLGVTRQRIQQERVAAVRRLAHPSPSLARRRLLGRARRADYQQARARQRRWARARRSPRRPRRQRRRP